VFRDSRGVVHTVSSADPLDDLPPDAARVLQEALLRPVEGDIGGALERCDAVRELVERWQDAFFAGLPDDFDVDEERRWAVEAGMSLEDIEAQYAEEDSELDLTIIDDDDEDDAPVDLLEAENDEDLTSVLPEELVSVLERELLLLPIRTRLEALVAAADLVENWSDLLADEEKLLGHLVLRHGGQGPDVQEHEALADLHAQLHAASGPGHLA
jgi:hypothetical protein